MPTPSEPAQPANAASSIPDTYQGLSEYIQSLPQPANLWALRERTMKEIEAKTGRPLISYVSNTAAQAPIDDADLAGFSDLVRSTDGENLDVFLTSNGGAPEAAERIVRLLRARFRNIRFIVAGNAFSAATMICFSGDCILMSLEGTLGPIDPQIGGVPARAILRGFDSLEARLKSEGPKALPAYVPMLSKYDLHILEICKSAQDLSRELAVSWLSEYMWKCDPADKKIVDAVDFFSDYDVHKSHGRSIDRKKAADTLNVQNTEAVGIDELVRSLYHQYTIWFDGTSFIKNFECVRGIHWGKQLRQATFTLPFLPQPVPNPPGPATPVSQA